MAKLTYRFCQYVPSLYKPTDCYDFGVVIASENEVCLYAIDITSFGIAVASLPWLPKESLFDVIHNRILKVLKDEPKSGHIALKLLGNRFPTNIQMTDIGERETERSTYEEAKELCKRMKQALAENVALRDHHLSWKPGFRSASEMLEACVSE